MSEHDEHELSDVNELSALRALAPQAAEQVEWLQPPADLWSRIAADAGVAPAAAPTPAPSPSLAPADPVSLAEHRRRRWAVPLSIAAAAVLVVVGIAVFAGRDAADEVAMVASVQLDTLAGGGLEHDGHLELHVHTAGLDAGDGYLELWMIDPTVSKLVSLGPLRADEVYVLPPGVDPAEYPIVDVSAEPVDGNPAHSGASLLRGELAPST